MLVGWQRESTVPRSPLIYSFTTVPFLSPDLVGQHVPRRLQCLYNRSLFACSSVFDRSRECFAQRELASSNRSHEKPLQEVGMSQDGDLHGGIPELEDEGLNQRFCTFPA